MVILLLVGFVPAASLALDRIEKPVRHHPVGALEEVPQFTHKAIIVDIGTEGPISLASTFSASPILLQITKTLFSIPQNRYALLSRPAPGHDFSRSAQSYRDYLGAPAPAEHLLWDEKLSMEFATEIDESETLEPYRNTSFRTIVIISIIILLTIMLFMVWYWTHLRGRIALDKNQTFLHTILDTAADGIIMIDDRGIIKIFNRAAQKLFGYSIEEAIGKNVNFLMPEPDHSQHDKYLTNYLTTGKAKIIGLGRDVTGLRKDGSTFPLHLAVSETCNDGKRCFTGIVHDLTQEKQSEEELRKLSRAVEQSPVTVIITDLQGNIEYVNPKFTETSGYNTNEAIGKNPRFLKSGHTSRKKYEQLWKTITSGKDWKGEFSNKKKNGELYWETASISPIKSHGGTISHFIAVKEDITERKHALEQLRIAKKSAEDANQAKSIFLANMSHEIRTPMNAIVGLTHLCLQTDLKPRQKDYLEKVQSSTRLLISIINDILDFSKIEAGKLTMEKINFRLSDVFENISSFISFSANEKKLELLFAADLNVPLFLAGDPLRLEQVLINLTANAIKFTQSGEVVIKVELVKEEPGRVMLKFSVRDTGIGISQDQILNLFKSFSQADPSTTRKYGGFGLGLTISKKLVEMMGGEISVESEPGKGSTFSFTAVFGHYSAGKEKTFAPSKDIRGIPILVVDGNGTSREILKNILVSLTFKVGLAASGRDAISELERAAKEKKPYELVIIDWKMPGMSVMEISQQIKTNPQICRTLITIMGSIWEREDILKQIEGSGINGFFTKPVNMSTLFNAIMEVFGKSSGVKISSLIKRDQKKQALKKIRGAQILLAEDNEINQEVAKGLLEEAGLIVKIANNGLEAVQMIKAIKFDGVLMDIQMPEMDGYEATRVIRKDSHFKTLPIIALTASVLTEDREKCLVAGMNDHIPKPINPENLISTLTKWIKP